jgi:SP family myo-inositol transporter-like MFS transporter 13
MTMFEEKKDATNVKFDSSSDKIEKIDTVPDHHAAFIEELSALESTAASKAAWLISITVSLGGLLFGITPHDHHLSL